jgi:predicted GIY-YIG superfamily endonuclease
MPAYVYVLRSAITGQHYIGATRDLQAKIARHNDTSAMLSRPGGPLECVYVEVCENLDAARTRERYLKSLDGVDEKIRILYTATARNPRK